MLGFRKPVFMLFALAVAAPSLAAAENTPLTRDEVTVIKRKLTAVADALGQPPAGYAREDESFSLPTETSKMQNSNAFHAVYASAHFKYGSGYEKKSKKSQKEMDADYKKKMMEAQAKGDYQEMSRVAQEMQQKAGKAQLDAQNAKKEPMDVNIQLNANSGQNIDPDAVVFEKPGVIALKFKTGDEDIIRIAVFFDPVHLKDTKTLSRVEMYDKQDKGVAGKTTVRNVAIEMTGPAAAVEAWAKAVSTGKVLGQIDAK